MGKWLKKHFFTIILVIILIAGLCLVLYPTVSDWWNSRHMSQVVAAYQDAVNNTSEAELEERLKEAEEYNARLAETGIHGNMSDEELEQYYSILDITGTGIMGYVEIPSIGVYLPIYHGTDEGVLQIAVGHLQETSFPVGGESTHAVLSGHRGLPSAKLFTDIDQLAETDIFTITVLNRTVTYMVDQIRIVLPTDTSLLQIYKGEDYATLVTCTPYGVNTHRLLIRGHRIENVLEEVEITPDAKKYNNAIVALAMGIPMLFLTLMILLAVYSRGSVNADAVLAGAREEYAEEARRKRAEEKDKPSIGGRENQDD